MRRDRTPSSSRPAALALLTLTLLAVSAWAPRPARAADDAEAEARRHYNDGRRLYDEQQVLLTPELSGALQALARRHKLTLNTIFQGAWALLLSRYSGSRDVLFGVAVSGRPPRCFSLRLRSRSS